MSYNPSQCASRAPRERGNKGRDKLVQDEMLSSLGGRNADSLVISEKASPNKAGQRMVRKSKL